MITLILRASARDGGQLAWWQVLRFELVGARLLLPLAVSIALGVSITEDRSAGFIRFITSRSLSRVSYLVAKFSAGAALGFVMIGTMTFLLGMAALRVGPLVGTSAPDATPLPDQFPQAPLLVVTCLALASALAAVFYLAIDALAAVITRNVYVVTAAPILLHLVGSLLLNNRLTPLNPMENLSLSADGLSPLSVALFWCGGTVLALGAASILVLRREAID